MTKNPIKNMQAAILVAQNQPLEVAEIELPPELNYGQVLVKIHYSGICGSQLGEIAGVKGPDKWMPHLLGHEGSGTVIEIGAGVKTVSVGDAVVLHWRPSDGIQADPPKYSRNGQTINAGWITTFNEYAIVSENRVTTIPQDFDMRLAPLFGCAVTTGLGAVNHDAAVEIGQSVLVFGVGGIGLSIVQGAALVSAHPIIGVDVNDAKTAMARQFGATHTLNASQNAELEQAIQEIVGTQGADVVFETTGNPRIIEMAYQLTHPDGKTILLGVPPKGETVSLYTLPLHFNKILTGSHGGNAVPHIEIPRYIRLHQAGKLALEGMITHEFSLNDINAALDVMRGGQAGRVVIHMT
jgi:S-(hydroxymethyl)glutathione dehydrogenase/alcohol dehydrogenase